MEKKSNSSGEIKNEDKLPLTTIKERFENGYYNVEKNGFYKLFHDIKLVCTILINFYSPGSANYKTVSKFYSFASELILRECYQLGIIMTKNIDTIDSNDSGKDLELDLTNELNKAISNDFIKIATNYKVPVPQSYHIKARGMDLFSSIIDKSVLDERTKELPNSNFEITNIVTQSEPLQDAPRLGFMAANTSNIPDPTLASTEIMTRFLHPNWYALPTTTWLKYGNYNSWAPSFNENGTVLDSTARGIIWLKKIGYNEMLQKESEKQQKLKDDDIKGNDDIKTEVSEEIRTENEKANGKMEEKTDEKKEDDTNEISDKEVSEKIALEDLISWDPSHYIDDDEIECFKNGTQTDLIEETLIKIQKLRKERIFKKIMKPSSEERHLYFKAKRIMKELIMNKQINGKLDIKPNNMFPIMQANYTGSIPVVRAQITRKRKYTTRR